MFYVIALIIDALAPTFGGQKNMNNAFKLVAYGSTASLVAAALYLFPMLSMLVLAGKLLRAVHDVPRVAGDDEKPAGKNPAVHGRHCGVRLCRRPADGVSFVVFWRPLRRHGQRWAMPAMPAAISIKTPGGEVKIDGKKIQEASKKLEEAGKKMEAATQAADRSQGVANRPIRPRPAKAVAEALGALAGLAGGREPVAASMLKEMLPETLGDLKRESFETKDGSAMGIKGSMAEAVYKAGERRVEIKIADTGGLAGLDGIGRMGQYYRRKRQQQCVREGLQARQSHGARTLNKGSNDVEYSLILANGVMVEVEGAGMDIAAARKIAEGLPLAKLESIGAK